MAPSRESAETMGLEPSGPEPGHLELLADLGQATMRKLHDLGLY